MNEKRKGTLLVISGPSGVGKSTVVSELLKKYSNMSFSISATTREMRRGDEEGRTYYFKTREEFEAMIENDELLEYAEYIGKFYGTPREPVFASLEEGTDVLLDIEIQGAEQVKARCPESLMIFLIPPSMEELRWRLENRNDLDEKTIERRLVRARDEYKRCPAVYDYIVVNDLVENAVREVEAILQAEKCRVDYRRHLLEV